MNLSNYQTSPIDRRAFQSLLDSQPLMSVHDTVRLFERLGKIFLLQKVDDDRSVIDDIVQWFDNEEFINQIWTNLIHFIEEAEGSLSTEQIMVIQFLFIKTIRTVVETEC